MKNFGVLLIVLGVMLGFYVGGYLCLYQGIVTVIMQIALVVKGSSIVATELAIAIIKILGASFAGGLSAVVPIFIGKCLLEE